MLQSNITDDKSRAQGAPTDYALCTLKVPHQPRLHSRLYLTMYTPPRLLPRVG